ncbi:MAG: hypothetical protein NVS4B10_21840 [Myxococcales bacterium]
MTGRFYPNPSGSGAFTTPGAATPAFVQSFPSLLFNPPLGTVPCSNATGVTKSTRPCTAVAPQPGGGCATAPAQGGGATGRV